MYKRGVLWDQVREIFASGQAPLINLTAEHEIVSPKRARPGRPRVRVYEGDQLVKARAFEHYLGDDHKARRPRGRNRGCQRYLMRGDLLVCSDFCRNDVLRETRRLVELLAPEQEAALERADSLPERLRAFRLFDQNLGK